MLSSLICGVMVSPSIVVRADSMTLGFWHCNMSCILDVAPASQEEGCVAPHLGIAPPRFGRRMQSCSDHSGTDPAL